jgi:hypothetical protein
LKKCDKCGGKTEAVLVICSYKLTRAAGIKPAKKPTHVCPNCFDQYCSYCGRPFEEFVKDSDGLVTAESAKYKDQRFQGIACPLCYKRVIAGIFQCQSDYIRRKCEYELQNKLKELNHEVTVVCAKCGGFNNSFLLSGKRRCGYCSNCREKFGYDNYRSHITIYNDPKKDFVGGPGS